MNEIGFARPRNIGLELRGEVNGVDAAPVERSPIFFDPWLACDHPRVEALVAKAAEEGEKQLAAERVRKRRERDRQTFLQLARALVSNAAFAFALRLNPPTVAIPVARPTDRRSRYDGLSLRPLKDVLKAIEPQLVSIRRSRRWGMLSALEAGPDLADCIAHLDDFGLAPP